MVQTMVGRPSTGAGLVDVGWTGDWYTTILAFMYSCYYKIDDTSHF